MLYLLTIILLNIVNVNSKVYFKEEFNEDKFDEIWHYSEYSGLKWGKFVLSIGKFYGDPVISRGIQTSENGKFYGLSTKFEPFSNKGKVLVIQFSVKHEQEIDCGGGYIKLFNCTLDPKYLHGETPYLIMFGPDICGHEKKKIHVIFNYKDKNLLIKKDIPCIDDVFTHLYTLVLNPDNTYKVKLDNDIIEEGELESDWNFLLPRKIKDPKIIKPEDWVDNPKMEDPNDKKPEDWDQPQYIPDTKAIKPIDWDDDLDGDWEPPQISNPEYKGMWKPKLIDNPNYEGPWIHPEIKNPHYKPDPYLYKYDEICAVGFDLWQVKSGTIFDNILITDNELEAQAHGDATWGAITAHEKIMKEKFDKEKDGEVAHETALIDKHVKEPSQNNVDEMDYHNEL